MTVLLFDIDNTLLDFDAAEYQALGQIFAHYGVADTPENRAIYSRENKALWRAHEAGEISREDLLSTRFVKAFAALELELPADGWKLDLEYEGYLAQGHQLIPHAKDLLDALSDKGMEMYVVSNGTSKVSRPRIVESGIVPYFREIFISEEVGAHKPSRDFFARVMAQIPDSRHKDFTIVGDSLSTDMKGGSAYGIHTVWYNPRHLLNDSDLVIEHEIADLLELPQAIGI